MPDACWPLAEAVRIWLVGFGTVGQWLVRALDVQAERLAERYGVGVAVVGLANARDGFIYDENGLDLASTLALAGEGRSIAEQAGVRCWPTAIEGLRATEADLLVEVTASPSTDGEPGLSHMREALQRGIPVVTSNKWPVALHGVQLAELARVRGVAFRAESTVMSGTPVLSTLIDGLAGTVPTALRGLLNATANFILTRMAGGRSYEDALAEAQRLGLAERDPAADVEGHDTVAKVMILSALVFGRQLATDAGHLPRDHGRRSLRDRSSRLHRWTDQARRDARLPRLRRERGHDRARATRTRRPRRSAGEHRGNDQRRGVHSSPVGDVTISGPGAGLKLAGQGVLSDVIAISRSLAGDVR